jgi:very-short-patch-repair endonuclease
MRVRARELRRSSPDAERSTCNGLQNRQLGGYKFRRQHPVGPFFADFACIEANLIVELDGGQHFEPEAMEADRRRTAFLSRMGYHVMRFTNQEALAERDAVLSFILDWLHIHHPHPSPLAQAGEGARQGTAS